MERQLTRHNNSAKEAMLTEIKRHHLLEQIQVQPLTTAHLEDVVALHGAILWWSFNGRMGQKHIHKLYESLLNDKNVFGFVCYINSKLVGFVTATTDSVATRRTIRSAYVSRIFAIILNLLKNPKAILPILESMFLVPGIFKRHGCNAEWLTFVTNTQNYFITPFVANKLMVTLDNKFKEMGIRRYMAQGIKANPPAMKYYQALNWKVTKALIAHNIYTFESGES